MRTKLRYNWHEFFKRFDVLLTPVAATAAFPHNRNPNRDERTVNVDGKSAPYAEQLFFAGLASLSAGNRCANRLDRRGITGGPADHRARG
jgi:amidase